MRLTIFYDGLCPLCDKEMTHLKKHNQLGQLAFVDINTDHFATDYPNLDYQALNDRIHALQDDGTMFIGLDATHRAWQLVGKGWVYAPLRWPVIRFFADKLYLVFAKHRYTISYWLTGKKRCDNRCDLKLK